MRIPSIQSLVLVLTGGILPGAHAQEEPTLAVAWLTNNSVQLEWTQVETPFIVQEATSLGGLSAWHQVSQPVVRAGDSLSLTLPASDTSRFFRLSTASLTHPVQTSPSTGETGVSVNRETIFRFDHALAADTLLDPTNVYAEFGGRRYLSRVELSSDRKTVTLFHLEPLPGNARVRVTFDAFATSTSTNAPRSACTNPANARTSSANSSALSRSA